MLASYGGSVTARGSRKDASPGIHILSPGLLQCVALWHPGVPCCSGVCSRFRTRRRAFSQVRGDTITSHQFFVVFTAFQWSSESSINWPSTSHSTVKPRRTTTVAIYRRSCSCLVDDDCQPIAQYGRRQLRSADTNVLAVPRTCTRLGDRSFPVAGPRIWNSLPASLRQPDSEYGQFKRLLKTFLYSETAAH